MSILFTFLAESMWSQDKSALQKKSKDLKSEIQKLNIQAQQTKKKARQTSRYLNTLNKKISVRTQLISNIEKEKSLIENNINQQQHQVSQLKKDLFTLKREYNEVLIKPYKNRAVQQKFLLLLSSNNLEQAFKRLKYLEKYDDFQKKSAEKISRKQGLLIASVQKLQENKKEKQTLIQRREKEKGELESETKEQNKLMSSLQKKQKDLAISIRKKQAKARKLDQQIKGLIANEIRLAKLRIKRKIKRLKEDLSRKGPEIAKKQKEEASSTRLLSIEQSKLTSDFSENKGRLPWPVSQGTVLKHFGKQTYPGLQGVYIDNSGVDILTSKGGLAKAIFQGTVSAVYSITSGVKAVLIQHGNYYSVYNNLQETYVQKGSKVKIGQSLGRVYTNSNEETLLNFQIWYNTSKQDPSHWIKAY
ncbi:MAG: murein hydrolase activator EnvC family protein [Flavobacteriales bacterium Tduv]